MLGNFLIPTSKKFEKIILEFNRVNINEKRILTVNRIANRRDKLNFWRRSNIEIKIKSIYLIGEFIWKK